MGKILWRRKWQPTPVFLPGKFHRQRSLAGYRPWSCKDSDITEHAHVSITNFIFLFGHAVCYEGSQFPDQGLNPHPLHWEHRVLTIGPQGSPKITNFKSPPPLMVNCMILTVIFFCFLFLQHFLNNYVP